MLLMPFQMLQGSFSKCPTMACFCPGLLSFFIFPDSLTSVLKVDTCTLSREWTVWWSLLSRYRRLFRPRQMRCFHLNLNSCANPSQSVSSKQSCSSELSSVLRTRTVLTAGLVLKMRGCTSSEIWSDKPSWWLCLCQGGFVNLGNKHFCGVGPVRLQFCG